MKIIAFHQRDAIEPGAEEGRYQHRRDDHREQSGGSGSDDAWGAHCQLNLAASKLTPRSVHDHPAATAPFQPSRQPTLDLVSELSVVN